MSRRSGTSLKGLTGFIIGGETLDSSDELDSEYEDDLNELRRYLQRAGSIGGPTVRNPPPPQQPQQMFPTKKAARKAAKKARQKPPPSKPKQAGNGAVPPKKPPQKQPESFGNNNNNSKPTAAGAAAAAAGEQTEEAPQKKSTRTTSKKASRRAAIKAAKNAPYKPPAPKEDKIPPYVFDPPPPPPPPTSRRQARNASSSSFYQPPSNQGSRRGRNASNQPRGSGRNASGQPSRSSKQGPRGRGKQAGHPKQRSPKPVPSLSVFCTRKILLTMDKQDIVKVWMATDQGQITKREDQAHYIKGQIFDFLMNKFKTAKVRSTLDDVIRQRPAYMKELLGYVVERGLLDDPDEFEDDEDGGLVAYDSLADICLDQIRSGLEAGELAVLPIWTVAEREKGTSKEMRKLGEAVFKHVLGHWNTPGVQLVVDNVVKTRPEWLIGLWNYGVYKTFEVERGGLVYDSEEFDDSYDYPFEFDSDDVTSSSSDEDYDDDGYYYGEDDYDEYSYGHMGYDCCLS